MTRYRFWQETGLGRDTAYRLYNDPTYIPTGQVLNKICSTYKIQPGEFLEWRDESQGRENNLKTAFSTNIEQETNLNQTNLENDFKSAIKLKIIYSNKEAS